MLSKSAFATAVNTLHIPELEAPRLRLRAPTHTDFDACASMWKEAEVVRFIGGAPLTREAAWSRFLRQMGAWHYLGFGFFVIEDKATSAFIGEVGFNDRTAKGWPKKQPEPHSPGL